MPDQAEDCLMQSTLPSSSIETSAEQEWSLNQITFQNPHRAISRSSPSYEKAVRVARPKVQHLSPSLRACLMCQLHKRKCDYGYPGQNRDNTKLHSKNLPCTRECFATRFECFKVLTERQIRLQTDGREAKARLSISAVLFLSEAL
jgi:hypothetical protein